MKKLGIDLGSASCGWTIREDNEIINKGVITFSTGMMKGKGGYSSPTRDRRKSRSKRRLIQARKYRKWELLRVLIDNDLVPLKIEELEVWSKYQKGKQRKFPESENFLKWLACDFRYEGGINYKNPYEIRVKGLSDQLTKNEFGRALYHIIQRRGYKDIGETDKETDKQIERREEGGFKDAMDEHRVISLALKKEFLDKGKRARNEYPLREEYEYEFELLCKKQGYDILKKKKEKYDDEFVKSLWKAIIWQRPLRSQKGKVGKCTLEPSSPRLPISHPLFEIFRTLQYINTIKTVDENGIKTQIPKEFREGLFNDVFFNRDINFSFSILKTYLDKKFQAKMEYNYLNKRTGKYDSTVSGMPVCKSFISSFDENKKIKKSLLDLTFYNKTNEIPKTINGYSIHDLWHLIFNCTDVSYLMDFAEGKLGIKSTYKKDKKGKEIKENKFTDLHKVFAQGYADLSARAIRKIIPFLQEGFLYNEAVVLAKVPKLLSKNWNENKVIIYDVIRKTSDLYSFKSDVINITNGLINQYKGLEYNYKLGYHPKDQYNELDYKLDKDDIVDIEKACEKYFGNKTWDRKDDKEKIINSVKEEYQSFFTDSKRAYRTKPTQTELFKDALKNIGIELDGKLYHHSNRKNIYLKTLTIDRKNGEYIFPVHKETGINILPVPIIDSIKNPMFNKAMSILRKLINELLIQGEIDEDTEIIVEVARELNDNNKRAAIERYQNEKKRNREKYREFIREFNTKKDRNINVDEIIDDFELWTEQIFDENNKVIDEKSPNRQSILKEKNAIDRYELWMEQKGQCMYTGKMISITQLFSDKIQMEHTIPRSLLPDNTKANQTVCFREYNNDIKNKKIPSECPNYKKDIDGIGTAIEPRLTTWGKIKESYQERYDKNKKPHGNEDENTKNKRIQDKHYFKMNLDYWKDKLSRFTCDEIKESWARRQLVDTQMISKYAREFLKTYFKKVNVEKGIITAEFRKIYGFQKQDEIKSRNKHTHHAIDAAVLTLIPNNASRKKSLLEKSYKYQEEYKKQFTQNPYPNFNAQELIKDIEETTLIFNHAKDKIVSQTCKKVRKRGEIQYIKNPKIKENIKWMKGDSIRGDLYGQTFLSKIKDVDRYDDGQPRRENGDWKYKKDKKGNDEFVYAKKVLVKDLKAKDIKEIIDPIIRKKFEEGFGKEDVYDNFNDKQNTGEKRKIRHVRIKTKKGRIVKERVNYRSKNEHKNFYYAAAGEIPYAVMLEKVIEVKGGKEVERKMIPIAIHEVAKVFKAYRKFNVDLYLNFFHNGLKEKYNNWKLLRVGQKVLVLKNDNELEEVADINFQRNRLYKIVKFDGNIWLKYHLEAQEDGDIDMAKKILKDKILREFEIELGVPEFKPYEGEKRKDFEKRKYSFDLLSRERFQRLLTVTNIDSLKKVKSKMEVHKKQASKLGKYPPSLLKLNKSESWNFLYEGEDFKMNILGNINILIENLTK